MHFKEIKHFYNKELIKLGFSANPLYTMYVFSYNVMKIKNHYDKICFMYIWSKILSSSLDALLE